MTTEVVLPLWDQKKEVKILPGSESGEDNMS